MDKIIYEPKLYSYFIHKTCRQYNLFLLPRIFYTLIPNYINNIPNYIENIPNYMENIPNYIENIPNYIENIPKVNEARDISIYLHVTYIFADYNSNY